MNFNKDCNLQFATDFPVNPGCQCGVLNSFNTTFYDSRKHDFSKI